MVGCEDTSQVTGGTTRKESFLLKCVQYLGVWELREREDHLLGWPCSTELGGSRELARIRECKDAAGVHGAEPSCRTHVSHGDSFLGPCPRKFLDFIRNSMGWDETIISVLCRCMHRTAVKERRRLRSKYCVGDRNCWEEVRERPDSGVKSKLGHQLTNKSPTLLPSPLPFPSSTSLSFMLHRLALRNARVATLAATPKVFLPPPGERVRTHFFLNLFS